MKHFYIVSNGGITMYVNVLDSMILERLTKGDIIVIDAAENHYSRRTRFGKPVWRLIKPLWVYADKMNLKGAEDAEKVETLDQLNFDKPITQKSSVFDVISQIWKGKNHDKKH